MTERQGAILNNTAMRGFLQGGHLSRDLNTVRSDSGAFLWKVLPRQMEQLT